MDTSPAVSIQVSVAAGNVAKVAMTKPGTDADPLKVVAPAFTTKKIGQSTKVPGQTNTITVTLVSATALAAFDANIVTISGLDGPTNSDGDLTLSSVTNGNNGHQLFKSGNNNDKGAWVQAAGGNPGTLKMTVKTTVT